MKKQRLLKIVQSVLSAESGRSMVEMLGVLAIIGVLSIGAVAGYKFALNKFRANEIINELNARALSVSAQMLSATTPYESDEVIEDGFGNTLAVGYPAESAVSSQNPEYFEITINGIPSEVCTQILRDYENPIMIFVNEVRYNNDTSLCTTESGTVDMGFIYRRDLGEREMCSEKGYFGEEDFICHCAGNTYIDPNNPNECLCPAGHVWSGESGEHGECIESICPEGQFESLNSGCVPCSDEATYTISSDQAHQDLCTASTCNRVITTFSNVTRCVKKCDPNEYITLRGECISCNSDEYNEKYITSGVSLESCLACGNRFQLSSFCVKEGWCPEGSHFYSYDQSKGGVLQCIPCNTTAEKWILRSQSFADISNCDNCRDTNGIQNRAVITENGVYYCGRALCQDNEFKGENNGCYSCETYDSIYIGSNESLKTLCNQCPNREVIDGYCRIKDCSPGNGMRMKDGACYPCNFYKNFGGIIYLTQMQDPSDCEKCPNRTASENQCYNNDACKVGESFWATSSHNCHLCNKKLDTTTSPACTALGCDLCDSCPYQHATQGYCVSNQRCETGKFNAKDTCYDCSYVDSVQIGTHAIEQGHCLNCTGTKRFWAGSYCYRCDTNETPSIDTLNKSEVASCTSCPQRDIIDGKCVLKQ